MEHQHSLAGFCRYGLETEGSSASAHPVRLAAVFREYIGLHSTPTLNETIDLMRRLGIEVEAVAYLPTGGTNMTARGTWYIHYSANDKPATQKFTIFHELFEIIVKTPAGDGLAIREPILSRYADRFAAAALIPPTFFRQRVAKSGCDVALLSEELELSHQCLLIALAEHLADMPLVAVLYEYHPDVTAGLFTDARDFVATVVVKTPPARWARQLCTSPLQLVPRRGIRPAYGSLVCMAITSRRPVVWWAPEDEDHPIILVRPLLWGGFEPYRVILLALPDIESSMLLPQMERVQPVQVNATARCPFIAECRPVSRKQGGCNE